MMEKKPTFSHALDIFVYHVGEIMTARAWVRVHFYGGVVGDYSFEMECDYPLPGDTARNADGYIFGNRCAARNDYMTRCAPVLAALAKDEDMDLLTDVAELRATMNGTGGK